MTSEEHRKEAPDTLHVGVITVSDSRAAAMEDGEDKDESGKLIEKRLNGSGHSSERVIIPDNEKKLSELLEDWLEDTEIDAIITTGGTGISERDITIDVARDYFDKELPGFGETLRRKGFESVGVPAIITMATLGIGNDKPVFCLPGAPNSVEEGMDLILMDLGHIVKHARE